MPSSLSAAAAALQPMVGFGCLHNSLPTCSVLYLPLQPMTLITTLSNSLVYGLPFFWKIISTSALF